MLLFNEYRSRSTDKYLFCKVFARLVCVFTVSVNTVFGDVVKSRLINNINNDKPVYNQDGMQNIIPNSFADVVRIYRDDNNGKLINFPEDSLFSTDIMWQMPGCCAVFMDNNLQQLYYAQKRFCGNGVNIPDNYSDLFSYSNYMHTERQLAI